MIFFSSVLEMMEAARPIQPFLHHKDVHLSSWQIGLALLLVGVVLAAVYAVAALAPRTVDGGHTGVRDRCVVRIRPWYEPQYII